MHHEIHEPELPYTPSHTGRRTGVGYLGLEGVSFNDLWPVFLGLGLSLLLALRFFVATPPRPGAWPWLTGVSVLPFALGFGYLRLLVVGRPPHFKGDLKENLLGLRIDLSHPPLGWLPVLPGLRLDRSAACGPERAADLRHPLRGGRS